MRRRNYRAARAVKILLKTRFRLIKQGVSPVFGERYESCLHAFIMREKRLREKSARNSPPMPPRRFAGFRQTRICGSTRKLSRARPSERFSRRRKVRRGFDRRRLARKRVLVADADRFGFRLGRASRAVFGSGCSPAGKFRRASRITDAGE